MSEVAVTAFAAPVSMGEDSGDVVVGAPRFEPVGRKREFRLIPRPVAPMPARSAAASVQPMAADEAPMKDLEFEFRAAS